MQRLLLRLGSLLVVGFFVAAVLRPAAGGADERRRLKHKAKPGRDGMGPPPAPAEFIDAHSVHLRRPDPAPGLPGYMTVGLKMKKKSLAFGAPDGEGDEPDEGDDEPPPRHIAAAHAVSPGTVSGSGSRSTAGRKKARIAAANDPSVPSLIAAATASSKDLSGVVAEPAGSDSRAHYVSGGDAEDSSPTSASASKGGGKTKHDRVGKRTTGLTVVGAPTKREVDGYYTARSRTGGGGKGTSFDDSMALSDAPVMAAPVPPSLVAVKHRGHGSKSAAPAPPPSKPDPILRGSAKAKKAEESMEAAAKAAADAMDRIKSRGGRPPKPIKPAAVEKLSSWSSSSEWTTPKLELVTATSIGISKAASEERVGGATLPLLLPPPPSAFEALGVDHSGSMVNRHLLPGPGGGALAARRPSPTVCTGGTCTPGGATTRLILLKLPSTGSTWVSELMTSGRFGKVNLARELLADADTQQSDSWKVKQMAQALRVPTKNHNKGAQPHGEATKGLDVNGFTINPCKSPGVDLVAVVKAASYPLGDVRIVVYIRTNIVKFAIGLWRAAQLRKACHRNNVRSAAELEACHLPSKRVVMPLTSFQRCFKLASLHNALMLGRAYAAANTLGLAVYELTYEDLQRDSDRALRGLFAHLAPAGAPPRKPDASKAAAGGDLTIKFTPDDMRELLENFDEIDSFLKQRAPCYAPMLHAAGPVSFAPCPLVSKSVY